MEHRIIKFRAWVNGSGTPRMIEWENIDAIEWCNDKLWHHDGEYTLLGNLVLMEVTGSSDDNKKHIWEADIISFPYFSTYEQRSFPEYVDFREKEIKRAIGVIYWHESELQWFVRPEGVYKTHYGDVGSESVLTDTPLAWLGIEPEALEEYNKDFDETDKIGADSLKIIVIGNIYEHPHLLQTTKPV